MSLSQNTFSGHPDTFQKNDNYPAKPGRKVTQTSLALLINVIDEFADTYSF